MADYLEIDQDGAEAGLDAGDVPALEMPELADTDLAAFFGAQGPLAQTLDDYELRGSQLEMALAIQRALLAYSHALIEAPTGTGKSIAYLVPAILTGKTIVVATANKSLQNQLYTKDIPFLEKVLKRTIPTVVVKGRSNFVCNYKWEKELAEQRTIALYDREDDQMRQMRAWLEATPTGDIDDLPFVVSNDLRPRVVSFTDDCLQRDCRFYDDDCWVNRMRDFAGEAQILITNHHLLLNALAFGEAGERILPAAPIYIIDEAHQLEQTATAVYETNVTDFTVEQLLGRSTIQEHMADDELDELRFLNTLAFQEAANQSRDNSAYALEGELEQMLRLAHRLRDLANRLKRENPYASITQGDGGTRRSQNGGEDESEQRRMYELAMEAVAATGEKLATVAQVGRPGEMVRYASRVFDRRRVSLELHAAPIDASNLLSKYLFHADRDDDSAPARTVICTSATLATDGHFNHFKQRCGIFEVGEELVLPPVFDYPHQALLYQPALPTFNGSNQDAYYDAVAQEIERLLEVSRGRALCLFTSWGGLQRVSDRLQALDRAVIWPLRAQGDAPRNALLEWFLATPNSVLLATRSFWEGVDIPGENLSLVVVDKLPFPTPGDPVHAARM
ncbi:MAG: ATP-dependent DNA helicase, partial [Litorilinea sp.]